MYIKKQSSAPSRAYGTSVRRHDNSLQNQHVDLKFSTHLLKSNQELSLKIGINFVHVMGTWSKPILGLWIKNKFCPNDLKFRTLVLFVIINVFWKKIRLRNKEVIAAGTEPSSKYKFQKPWNINLKICD